MRLVLPRIWPAPPHRLAYRARIRAGLKLLLVAFTIAAPGVAAAGPLEDGNGAYQLGDYAKAYELWRPLAEADNAQAQLLVSDLFAEGKGVELNPVRAVFWLTRAATSGLVEAQYRLAMDYYQGQVVPRDLDQARAWWEKAALQGDANSLYSLARLYHTGEGVKIDLDRAEQLYKAAAERGSTWAQQGLTQLRADRQRLSKTQSAGRGAGGGPDIGIAPGSPLDRGVNPKQAAEALQQVHDASWINAQAPTSYTVQVFTSRAPESARQFLLGFNGTEDTAVFSFKRKDALWYAVVYGSYPTEDLANRAVERLVDMGNKIETWIRRFGNIQAMDPH